jgi:hypothetical protein
MTTTSQVQKLMLQMYVRLARGASFARFSLAWRSEIILSSEQHLLISLLMSWKPRDLFTGGREQLALLSTLSIYANLITYAHTAAVQ